MAQLIVDSLLRASDLMLVTLGLSTVYALVRFPNSAQPEYATIGAFLALFLVSVGVPLVVSAIIATVLTGIVAVLMHRHIFRRLLRISPVVAMIGSFAVAMIIRASLQAIAGTRSARFDVPIEAPIQFMGASLTIVQAIVLGITAAVCIIFFFVLYKTNLGRSMRAVATQPDLAKACGISSERVLTRVGFISGCFAGLGGILLAVTSQVYFNLGQDLLLPVFAAAIVGGLGSPVGAVFGVLLLAFAETLVINVDFSFITGQDFSYVPIAYGPAASFLLLIVTLIFRPRGLLFRETSRV
ncbi:ABC transporter permease [Brucella anthropi]|uniref:branched-chain amino acid ABC transporter permease n=1 Tax=Brucella anthropi TaxID=529 RepID=UPI00044AA22E|nr:branched-chain amino acid ABC transporter permease [Brucella anthropi]EXL06508.1 ABC transporter permease [Brucella anthropi]